MILSFTENGEMSIIFLVMRLMILFGEYIQCNFRQITSEIHILFSVMFFRMSSLLCSTYVVRD